MILLFDVLEHITEEDQFLNALLFHLKPHGKLVINVPAGQWAFSLDTTMPTDTSADVRKEYACERRAQWPEDSTMELLGLLSPHQPSAPGNFG